MDILPNGPPLVQWRYELSYRWARSEPFASTQAEAHDRRLCCAADGAIVLRIGVSVFNSR